MFWCFNNEIHSKFMCLFSCGGALICNQQKSEQALFWWECVFNSGKRNNKQKLFSKYRITLHIHHLKKRNTSRTLILTNHVEILLAFVFILTNHVEILLAFVFILTNHVEILLAFIFILTNHLEILLAFVFIFTNHIEILLVFVFIFTNHVEILILFVFFVI